MKSSTRSRNSENPSLLYLVINNNDDLIDNVSLLPPLDKSDHSAVEVLVNDSWIILLINFILSTIILILILLERHSMTNLIHT